MTSSTEANKSLQRRRDDRHMSASGFRKLNATTRAQRSRRPEPRNVTNRSDRSHRERSQSCAPHTRDAHSNASSRTASSHSVASSGSATSKEGSDSYIHIPGDVTLDYSLSVSKVLNTTELLEQILVYVPPVDLLRAASLTCKGFRTVVYGSTILQRIMFLAPDHEARYGTTMPYPMCGPALSESSYHEQVIYSFKPINLDRFHRMRGKRNLRQVLLTQPPIHRSTLRFNATLNHVFSRYPYHSTADVNSGTAVGITMGDVLDAFGRKLEEELGKRPELLNPTADLDLEILRYGRWPSRVPEGEDHLLCEVVPRLPPTWNHPYRRFVTRNLYHRTSSR